MQTATHQDDLRPRPARRARITSIKPVKNGSGRTTGTTGTKGASDKPASRFEQDVVALIPHLRRYALSLTHNGDRADDLVQDCLVRALRHRARYQPGTNLRAWLFTVLHNAFIDGTRRGARWHRSVSIEDSGFPLPTRASQEHRMEIERLARAIEQLPADQRSALMLVGVEGCAYEEAAGICGVAIGTIKSRVHRARESLRHFAEQAPAEESGPQTV